LRVLIVPGLNGSGPGHWQTLWENQYNFDRVQQRDWGDPNAALWVETLNAAILAHPDKVVIVAHSLGCWTVIHWVALYADYNDRVQSAMLVAPPDIESSAAIPKSAMDFTRHRTRKLPFPSVLVGSENDPHATLDKAQALAQAMGSSFVNAGHVGHINIDSGHGPWLQGEILLWELINDSRQHSQNKDDQKD
jgi:uncharacterized protein